MTKTEFAERPQPYKIDVSGNLAVVTLLENVEESVGADKEERWTADVYTIATFASPNLEQRVRNSAANWLQAAKEKEKEPKPKTPQDETDEMMIDHEVRLICLELGTEV